MLSDEEKKAIEYIKNCLDDEYDFKNATRQKDKEAHNIILNLIEKQSKEIEESEQKERKAYIKGTNDAHELCNKKWEDKIKAKIEEQEKIINTGGIDFNTKSYARCKIEFGQSLLEKE